MRVRRVKIEYICLDESPAQSDSLCRCCEISGRTRVLTSAAGGSLWEGWAAWWALRFASACGHTGSAALVFSWMFWVWEGQRTLLPALTREGTVGIFVAGAGGILSGG